MNDRESTRRCESPATRRPRRHRPGQRLYALRMDRSVRTEIAPAIPGWPISRESARRHVVAAPGGKGRGFLQLIVEFGLLFTGKGFVHACLTRSGHLSVSSNYRLAGAPAQPRRRAIIAALPARPPAAHSPRCPGSLPPSPCLSSPPSRLPPLRWRCPSAASRSNRHRSCARCSAPRMPGLVDHGSRYAAPRHGPGSRCGSVRSSRQKVSSVEPGMMPPAFTSV